MAIKCNNSKVWRGHENVALKDIKGINIKLNYTDQ